VAIQVCFPLVSYVEIAHLPPFPDTQRYWNLTKHIFRYSHVDEAHEAGGEHTVNEGLSLGYVRENFVDIAW